MERVRVSATASESVIGRELTGQKFHTKYLQSKGLNLYNLFFFTYILTVTYNASQVGFG